MTAIDIDDDLLAMAYDQSDADTVPEAVEHALWLWIAIGNPYEVLVAEGYVDPDDAPDAHNPVGVPGDD